MVANINWIKRFVDVVSKLFVFAFSRQKRKLGEELKQERARKVLTMQQIKKNPRNLKWLWVFNKYSYTKKHTVWLDLNQRRVNRPLKLHHLLSHFKSCDDTFENFFMLLIRKECKWKWSSQLWSNEDYCQATIWLCFAPKNRKQQNKELLDKSKCVHTLIQMCLWCSFVSELLWSLGDIYVSFQSFLMWKICNGSGLLTCIL